MFQRVACIVSISLLTVASTCAVARVVELDFPATIFSGPITDNQTTPNGFRISPHCHIDGLSENASVLWLGFDGSGCTGSGEHFNPNYLGPNPVGDNVFVDYFGAPFDLLSLDFATMDMAGFIRSSNGGYVDLGPNYLVGDNVRLTTFETLSFSGPEWTSINWIEFGHPGFAPGAPNVQLTNITLRVPSPTPSPGTLPLAAIAAGALVVMSRRRMNAANAGSEGVSRL